MEHATHELSGPDGRVLVLRLPADLNHDSADAVRALLARVLPNREGAAAVIDLGAVRLITSIGIAALLQMEEFCRDRAAPMVLANVPKSQQAFLKMLKLDRKFVQAESIDEAIQRAVGSAG